MSAVDSINIYIALNVVIQSWQIYCIRMKTEFLMNSIWSILFFIIIFDEYQENPSRQQSFTADNVN